MISVCNKQDLNSLLAKSVECDGKQLMTMLKKMGISQEDPVTLSIQGDDGETLASYQFAMPEKSPIIDNNQPPIDMEKTIKTCLSSWEEKYGFLSELPKSEPSADGTTKTLYKFTFNIGSFQFGEPLVESPRLQISISPVVDCTVNVCDLD